MGDVIKKLLDEDYTWSDIISECPAGEPDALAEICEHIQQLEAKVERLTSRGFQDLHFENEQLKAELSRYKAFSEARSTLIAKNLADRIRSKLLDGNNRPGLMLSRTDLVNIVTVIERIPPTEEA